MPTIENIECYLATPMGRLVEYPDHTLGPDDGLSLGGRNHTVYVPSTSDTAFTINLDLDPDFAYSHCEANGLLTTVVVNGAPYAVNRFAGLTTKLHTFDTVFSRDGRFSHSLRFAALETTEDERYKVPDAAERLKDLGEIRVELRRYYMTGSREYPVALVAPEIRAPEQWGPVYENAVRGCNLAHVAGLGEGRPREDNGGYVWLAEGMDLDPEQVPPYMTFRFLYRSEHALRSLGVIPRTPSPELVPIEVSSERRLEGLMCSQCLRKPRQLESQAGSPARRIKRERDSDAPVKEEDAPVKRRKTTVYIDLTED